MVYRTDPHCAPLVAVRASASIKASNFNLAVGAWEPVIEPWAVEATWAVLSKEAEPESNALAAAEPSLPRVGRRGSAPNLGKRGSITSLKKPLAELKAAERPLALEACLAITSKVPHKQVT